MTLSIIEIALISVALGCDAFAVGLGVGTTNCAPRQVFRLSFHFGLFQFLMPLVGWLSGRYILGVLNQNLFMVAVWIGIVAAAMTWSAMKIGNRLSQKFANRIEIIGGLILIFMALKLRFI